MKSYQAKKINQLLISSKLINLTIKVITLNLTQNFFLLIELIVLSIHESFKRFKNNVNFFESLSKIFHCVIDVHEIIIR
jgi:hypothetical protein